MGHAVKNGVYLYDFNIPRYKYGRRSREDKEYWELLQMMSEAVKKGIDLYDFDILCYKYGRKNLESGN